MDLRNSGRPGRWPRTSARLILALGAALAISILTSANAAAATFTVTGTSDIALGGTNDCTGATGHTCTLRAAIQAANTAGGTNTVTVPTGHYALTLGELDVSNTLTITGAGSSTTIVDAGGTPTMTTSRVFNVTTSGSLMMSGVTVENGHPADNTSGGGILASGPLTLTNVVVTANTVSDPTSTATSAETVGAGIEQGCAVYDGCGNLNAPITLTNVTLSNNQVLAPVANYAAGGGLFESTGSPVTISNSAITGNSAPIGGGIVEAGGTGSGAGGGATITITGSRLSGNSATGNPCASCAGNGTGGAVESAGLNPPVGTTLGDLILGSDTLTGNTSTKGGGAIADYFGDSYVIIAATIANNTAGTSGSTTHGGGILGNALTGSWTVANSTFAGNKAFGPGQQISLFNNHPAKSSSQLTLNFTTLDGTGGGVGAELENSSALAGDAGSASVRDTIINGGPGTDCAGSITSAGHNLVSDSTCGFSATGDQVNPTVGLTALASNGGPTQTEALSASSPAIDQGGTTCLTTDQRGDARPDQAGTQCDIGAFEFQGNPSPGTNPPSVLSGLRISPHKVSIAGRNVKGKCVKPTKKNKHHKSCRRPIKLRVGYTLSRAATVSFTIKRQLAGRKVKRKCFKPTKKNKKRQHCTRSVSVPGSITLAGTAGANTFTFDGRIGGKKLALGSYVLTATPTGGQPHTVTFKITR